jgi:hypothetical protein
MLNELAGLAGVCFGISVVSLGSLLVLIMKWYYHDDGLVQLQLAMKHLVA